MDRKKLIDEATQSIRELKALIASKERLLTALTKVRQEYAVQYAKEKGFQIGDIVRRAGNGTLWCITDIRLEDTDVYAEAEAVDFDDEYQYLDIDNIIQAHKGL